MPTLPVASSALLLLAATGAWADRPLVSDTADVIAADACQVETQATRTGSQPAVRGASALLSCGTAWSTQWALGAGGDDSADAGSRSLLLAGKTTLVMPASGVTGWGLSYAVASGRSAHRTVSADTTTLLLLVTREVTPGWLVHGNAGPSNSRLARQNSLQWSLGTETTANPTVAADVYGDNHGRPWVSAGAGYNLNTVFSLNIAAARQFQQPPQRQVSLGAKLVF